MFNDLIGLRYGWGCRPGDGSERTDCFQLFCEARRRLGLSDYASRFEWVYGAYGEGSLPKGQILRWVIENSVRSAAVPGSVIVFPGESAGAMATITEFGVLCIGPGQNVIHAPMPSVRVHSYWMKP